MRLIDADEVLKRWGLKFYAMGGDRLGPNGDEISFYVNGLLNEIQNAPTVERPQGEWIEESSEIGALGIKYTWVRCNRCGWDNSLVIPKSFCPNCGADMRGGRE